MASSDFLSAMFCNALKVRYIQIGRSDRIFGMAVATLVILRHNSKPIYCYDSKTNYCCDAVYFDAGRVCLGA